MYNKHNLVAREIKRIQKLKKIKCKKIWEFINPYNEKYIFGLFEDTIVTIAYFEPRSQKYIISF